MRKQHTQEVSPQYFPANSCSGWNQILVKYLVSGLSHSERISLHWWDLKFYRFYTWTQALILFFPGIFRSIRRGEVSRWGIQPILQPVHSIPGHLFPIISRQNKQYKKYKTQLPRTQIILNTQIQLWTLDLDSSTEKQNTVTMFSLKKGKDEQGRGVLEITRRSSHSNTPVVTLPEFSLCAVTDFLL